MVYLVILHQRELKLGMESKEEAKNWLIGPFELLTVSMRSERATYWASHVIALYTHMTQRWPSCIFGVILVIFKSHGPNFIYFWCYKLYIKFTSLRNELSMKMSPYVVINPRTVLICIFRNWFRKKFSWNLFEKKLFWPTFVHFRLYDTKTWNLGLLAQILKDCS